MTGGAGPSFSRRRLLAATGLAGAGAVAAVALPGTGGAAPSAASDPTATTLAFHGAHQQGIATPEQARMVFASFDVSGDRTALSELLTAWTAAAHQLTTGQPIAGPADPFAPPVDTGEALDLPASRLTLTVGYGPSLFDDRFGLAPRRPAALVALPAFPGDALDPARSDGDLCIQACADDTQVAFHAVHTLTRMALGTATLRWIQFGFGRTAAPGAGGATPRNLLGFKDGTDNLVTTSSTALSTHVWVDDRSDQSWMTGGTYLVARRIRTHLEAWDRSTLHDQERTIGRVKGSGAPLGRGAERDPVDLAALDSSGRPSIPVDAHIRLAAPSANHGAAILRRGYSFADGIDPATGELDAGLFFVCFQKDPTRQFIPIQQRLAEQDALAHYLVHTGSAVFACPPGTSPGRPWGHGLL